MNKDLLNQLPADEQPLAAKLNSLAEDMDLSQNFQWELETQLMDKAKNKTQPMQGWHLKILPTLAWAVLVAGVVFLLNWTISSLANQTTPSAGELPGPDTSFASQVSQGEICRGPLAGVHEYAGFLTNPDMTGFIPLDEEGALGEVRSVAWSPDGTQLAIAGNTAGQGSLLFTDPEGNRLDYLIYGSDLGYLMDAAWSRNGKQIVLWSSQNNRVVYLLSSDGTGLVEKQLQAQIFGTPRFWPDGLSIIFYGATPSSTGLFELVLDRSEAGLIKSDVEDESGYIFSPDGTHLAYMTYDRDTGQAALYSENLTTRELAVLGTLPIPKGSGSSIPETANLSWSADGNFLVFEFGRGQADRAIYLAHADGSGLVKVVDSAHAPTFSADGRCLAYIDHNEVFLLDMAAVSSNSVPATPILLAELPAGRSTSNFKLDKLQWRP